MAIQFQPKCHVIPSLHIFILALSFIPLSNNFLSLFMFLFLSCHTSIYPQCDTRVKDFLKNYFNSKHISEWQTVVNHWKGIKLTEKVWGSSMDTRSVSILKSSSGKSFIAVKRERTPCSWRRFSHSSEMRGTNHRWSCEEECWCPLLERL